MGIIDWAGRQARGFADALKTEPPALYQIFQDQGGRAGMRKSQYDHETTQLARTKPFQNEVTWLRDATIFAGVGLYVELMMDVGYEVESKDTMTQMAIDRWFDQLEDEDGGLDWFNKVVFELGGTHIGVYGENFIEKITGKSGSIWSVTIVDPRTIDFQREEGVGVGDVIRDKLGRPKGFVQSTHDAETIPFSRAQMQHNTYTQLHPTEHGIGFAEALIMPATMKLNVMDARSEIAFNRARPKPMVKFGNLFSGPAADSRALAIELRDDLVDESYAGFIVPEHLDVTPWNVVGADETDADFINLIIEMQAGVLKIPKPILMQTAEGFSRQGFDLMMQFFERPFRNYQNRTGLRELVTSILRQNGDPHKGITVKWGELTDRKDNEASQRVLRMSKGDLLPKDMPEVTEKALELSGITVKPGQRSRPVDPNIKPSSEDGEGESNG